ncbi:MAG TPA: plastocyanin/azurin family copper-binding protein [Candidatus Angelobacter sp.]|jgi:plastocyanin|nr:plastocyanin/azurin family copper-binding protein [Candidatus Angelobacter sp.]
MRAKIIAAAVPVLSAGALLFGSQPAAAGGGGCFQPDTSGAGTTVEIKSICFAPTVLFVQLGATVTWKNEDGLRHVVIGSYSSWSGGVANLEAGQTTTRQFPTAGIYPYSCPLHYGMNGVIVVGDGGASTRITTIRQAGAAPAKDPQALDPWPLLAVLAIIAAGGLGYGLGRRRGVPVTKP